MVDRVLGARIGYFVVIGIGLIILVTKAQSHVLPDGLSRQIGHNSEALCFALLVMVVFLALRGRQSTRASIGASLAAAAALFLTAWLLVGSDLPSTLVTLNEPLVGVGLVLLYLQLPRSPRLAIAVAALVLVAIIVFFDTDFVLDQAESLVPLLLAPLSIDVFDRGLALPDEFSPHRMRVVWTVLLVAMGLLAMSLAKWAREDLEGSVRLGIDYAQRAAEAYWGWLIVHLAAPWVLGYRSPTPSAGTAATTTESA